MRAVDAMLDAIRAEQPVEPDWDAVERSLLKRVARGEGARPVARAPSGAWRAIAFAAAAAVVPIAMSLATSSNAPVAAPQTRDVDAASVAAAPGEAGARGERDLAALQSGDSIEAKDGAVTFADADKVRWTLAAGSKLTVRSPLPSSGVGHVVKLERGSLRVEVRPDLVQKGLVDVLAVEVGNTRVAVHGTAFTVTLRNGEVLVDVEHGVVTVGPTGQRGATTGYQLPAGSRAAFSLDGGRRARFLRKDEDVAPPQPVAAVRATAPDVAIAPAAPSATPEPAPADDVPSMTDPPPAHKGSSSPLASNAPAQPAPQAQPEPAPRAQPEPPKAVMNTAGVQAGLKRCFVQAHPNVGIGGATLTASSTFLLHIRADGSVESAQFNPPLPSIQGCAAFVYGGKFASASAGYTLSIPVSLSQ
jgi:hypothetical protein